MEAAYISAFAALAGSAIGASASFATTWLTQHAQQRAMRLEQEMSRRERLYGEFINEASRLIADALTHHLEDPSKMVVLYASMGKLRLFAPANVVGRADEVMGSKSMICRMRTSATRRTGPRSSASTFCGPSARPAGTICSATRGAAWPHETPNSGA
jgi:hypothetical protein